MEVRHGGRGSVVSQTGWESTLGAVVPMISTASAVAGSGRTVAGVSARDLAAAVAAYYPFNQYDPDGLVDSLVAYGAGRVVFANLTLSERWIDSALWGAHATEAHTGLVIARQELTERQRAWLVHDATGRFALKSVVRYGRLTHADLMSLLNRVDRRALWDIVLRRPLQYGLPGAAPLVDLLERAVPSTRVLYLALAGEELFAERELTWWRQGYLGTVGAWALGAAMDHRPALLRAAINDGPRRVRQLTFESPLLVEPDLQWRAAALDSDIPDGRWTKREAAGARRLLSHPALDPQVEVRLRERLRIAGVAYERVNGGAVRAPETGFSTEAELLTAVEQRGQHSTLARDAADHARDAASSAPEDSALNGVERATREYVCWAAQEMADTPSGWPTLFALADNWEGTAGELVETARYLAAERVRRSEGVDRERTTA